MVPVFCKFMKIKH